jgi:hypothetical protein
MVSDVCMRGQDGVANRPRLPLITKPIGASRAPLRVPFRARQGPRQRPGASRTFSPRVTDTGSDIVDRM